MTCWIISRPGWRTLPERPRADLIEPVVHPGFLLRCPEAELLGPAVVLKPAPVEREESGGARGDDAELPEIGKAAAEETVSIMRGIGSAAEACGSAVIGGDLSAASELMITVTVMGRADRPVLRTGATSGRSGAARPAAFAASRQATSIPSSIPASARSA